MRISCRLSSRIESTMWVTVVGEGDIDVAILKRVLRDHGMEVAHAYPTGGKPSLDRNLQGYNNAARHSPWVVLRDLNGDAPCASALVQTLLPLPSTHMRLRIAVRAVESWLLADAEAMGRFLGVRVAHIPPQPETVNRPKLEIVNLARRSRLHSVR